LELIAIATGGRIVPRFQELSPEKLGKVSSSAHILFQLYGTCIVNHILMMWCPIMQL